MGLYSGGLIIGRIFASEIWGGLFSGRLIYFLFILIFLLRGGIIGILRVLRRTKSSIDRKR